MNRHSKRFNSCLVEKKKGFGVLAYERWYWK